MSKTSDKILEYFGVDEYKKLDYKDLEKHLELPLKTIKNTVILMVSSNQLLKTVENGEVMVKVNIDKFIDYENLYKWAEQIILKHSLITLEELNNAKEMIGKTIFQNYLKKISYENDKK